jgi:hypothetical protein
MSTSSPKSRSLLTNASDLRPASTFDSQSLKGASWCAIGHPFARTSFAGHMGQCRLAKKLTVFADPVDGAGGNDAPDLLIYRYA